MTELELLEDDVEWRDLPPNPWIDSIYLDNKPVDLSNVVASVTIRHGRDDPDGPIQASTANVQLEGISRDAYSDFEVGHVLTIYGRPAEFRYLFQGRLSDGSITDDGVSSTPIVSLIAAGILADLGSVNIGGHAWPAEPWRSRILRIATEVSNFFVINPPSPDVPIAATKPTDPEAGTYASVDALTALEDARNDVGATVFDDGNGTIHVQAFEARAGL